jgi:predicted amidohydrolase
VEHSVCPHDIWDWWVEKYGCSLEAFWPVADTEIGRLGIMMANEGSYPENARALAMNGAESGLSRILSASGDRQRAV